MESSASPSVADGDELAFVVAVLDLDVGQRGQAARAPVDDPFGPVDQAVVEELLEDRLHGAGQALVHREPLAGPVHAVADTAHLTENLAAGFGLPLPDALDEGLPAQVVAAQALLGELALHHVLGGDPGVVHARHPQGVEALHTAPPDLRVDQRVVKRVADVQGTGDVRRWDDDAERGSGGFRVRGEVTCLLPAFIARPLHLGGRVLGRQLDRQSGRLCSRQVSLRPAGPLPYSLAGPPPQEARTSTAFLTSRASVEAPGYFTAASPLRNCTSPKVVLVTHTHSLAWEPPEVL